MARYLLKVKIETKNGVWKLTPVNPRSNEKQLKLELTDFDFKTLLRRIKAKDSDTSPRSSKNRTYQQMIDEAINNTDNIIWVWSTFYPVTKDVAMELAIN